jgi:hypothetical protein
MNITAISLFFKILISLYGILAIFPMCPEK